VKNGIQETGENKAELQRKKAFPTGSTGFTEILLTADSTDYADARSVRLALLRTQ